MITHKILQILQFMTYVSTMEEDLNSTMSILNNMTDTENQNFITTIENINYIGVQLTNIHTNAKVYLRA